MEFKKIRKEVLNQIKKRYNLNLESQETLNEELSSYGKEYKGDFETQKAKLLKFIEKKRLNEIEEELNFINSVEEADDFKNDLVITIEWKKSRMWGSNPKAYTNYGFESESIGGCGYCKTSTATAYALNSHKPILKLLYTMEEKRLNKKIKTDRRDFIGYGSGYYALPKFEGGVGVSSHEMIIKNLGLNWKCVTDTTSTDVFLINKK